MRCPHYLIGIASIAGFAASVIAYSVFFAPPARFDPATFAGMAVLLNADIGERMVVVGRPGISLEDNESVYLTSTKKSFDELNQMVLGNEAQWQGTLVLIKRHPWMQHIAPDALIGQHFVVGGDPELLERLRGR